MFSTELHLRLRQVFLTSLGLLTGLLLVVPAVAKADVHELPSLEDPLPRPKAVHGRKYVLAGKHDIGLFGAANVSPKLTNHYGGALSYAYYFNEYFAIEALVGGGYAGVTGLGNVVRHPPPNEPRKFSASEDDMPDTGALLALGQVGLRFTPFYGKVNIASELPVNLALYFVGGLGGAYVNYESMQACASKPSAQGSSADSGHVCDAYQSSQAPTFAFSAGLGLRFYIGDFAIKTEYRSVFFPDSYRVGINGLDPASNPGTEAADAGLTHHPMVFLGGSYAF